MRESSIRIAIIVFLLLASAQVHAQSQTAPEVPWRGGEEKSARSDSAAVSNQDKQASGTVVWNTTISPIHSADVAAEVAGVLEKIHFDEGDVVKEGQEVARIFDGRYRDAVEKLKAKLKGQEFDLRRAEEEVRIQEELLSLKATTRQELLKARVEADVLRTRIAETKNELETAARDLEACAIRAPFTGSISARHKQPYESVERYGKIFSLVDATKVYAIANIDEQVAPSFERGSKAIFVHRSGRPFEGVIERVNSVLDPKSKTKKVYCLIDNAKGTLASGMVGTLRGLER